MRKNIGIEEGYWKKIGLLKKINNKKINNNGKNFEITEENFKLRRKKFKLRRQQIQIKTKMKSRKKPFFGKKNIVSSVEPKRMILCSFYFFK